MKNEYCEGCKFNWSTDCSSHNANGDCPCTNCLVKAICSTECDEFCEFESSTHNVIYFKNQEEKA